MDKKLIRLTEGDLHRIIKESVETILKEAQLNELDPRTYMSAKNKQNKIDAQYDKEMADYNSMNRMKRMFTKKPQVPKGYGRGKKFNDAAIHSFNMSKVGNMKVNDPDYTKRDLENYSQDMSYDGNLSQTFGNSGTRKYYDFTRSNEAPLGTVRYYNRGEYGDSPSIPIDSLYNEYEPQAFRMGKKIASQMKNGDGEYIKGKGWQ